MVIGERPSPELAGHLDQCDGCRASVEAMDSLAPGVAGPETLLYGVEVKFYSSRLQVDAELRTPVEGLWAIGDGAGVTRGLVQSGASGVVAARSVARRLGERDAQAC